MPLHSQLFRGVPALEACLVHDSAHITPGSQGAHVQLIQRALIYLGDRSIPTKEYAEGTYGPKTASAVLRFKRAKKIINYAYQTSADNIVGKMTIARLDREVCSKEYDPRLSRPPV